MKYIIYFSIAVLILYCCTSCSPRYMGNVVSLEGNIVGVSNNHFEVFTNPPVMGQYVTFKPTYRKSKANSRIIREHLCKWPLCPYKGIKPKMYVKSVIEYTGEYNTVGYLLDILHLYYPFDEYEELEAKLSK